MPKAKIEHCWELNMLQTVEMLTQQGKDIKGVLSRKTIAVRGQCRHFKPGNLLSSEAVSDPCGDRHLELFVLVGLHHEQDPKDKCHQIDDAV